MKQSEPSDERRPRSRTRRFGRCCRSLVLLAGVAALLLLASCFTQLPWRLYRWLSLKGDAGEGTVPEVIVVMGGGGIPSESGLMRTYHAAELAQRFPDAQVIVALPSGGGPESGSTGKMKKELVLRGVAGDRILMEHEGRNTREQVLGIERMLRPEFAAKRLLVVTTSGHARRAVLCFRRVGFENVHAATVFTQGVKTDLEYSGEEAGGHTRVLPGVGKNMVLRYTFWNNVEYLAMSSRELAALLYYKAKDWI